MPKFRIEKPLPSANIGLAFLQELDAYLDGQIDAFSEGDSDHLISRSSFVLVDGLGTEKFSSVSEYGSSNFSDSTVRIELYKQHVTNREKELTIHIQFGQKKHRTEIEIDCAASNARVWVTGIYNDVVTRTERVANSNWVFELTPFADGVRSAITIMGFFLAATVVRINVSWAVTFFGLSVLSFSLARASTYRPYSRFDTRRNERLDGIYKWAAGGLLSFLVFTVAATWLWDRISILIFGTD